MAIKDLQSTRDSRRIPIRKVGIKNLRYPIAVLDRDNKVQHTVADVSMFVDLPHHFKGTHMSRFVQLLHEQRGRISLRNIDMLLKAMVRRFESQTAHLEIRFPYFMEKSAPVSGARSLMDYQCAFLAAYQRHRPIELTSEVVVPVCTLCPCSRAISVLGAHNQRSLVTVQARSRELVWFEELITICEQEASSGLYALLKREDEKHVTEKAYARPRFAEDMARAVARRLRRDQRIIWFQVASENMESIHNHNAYALVTSDSF